LSPTHFPLAGGGASQVLTQRAVSDVLAFVEKEGYGQYNIHAVFIPVRGRFVSQHHIIHFIQGWLAAQVCVGRG